MRAHARESSISAQVITVTPEMAALDAAALMAAEGIAGVGVVNNLSGALIGNFSFSDLRCAHAARPTALWSRPCRCLGEAIVLWPCLQGGE
jgi:CBS domain-containing protein